MIDTGDERSTTRSTLFLRQGIPVYGLGALALGLIGVVSGDFADVWQPVPSGTPFRTVLAYATAVCLIFGSIAIQKRRTARAGAILLGVLYSVFAILWLPRVIGYPLIFATWGGVFEQLSLVAAALAIYALPDTGLTASGIARAGRILFGICALAFAFNHFFALPQTADFVPKWIPPNQYFWAVFTGIAHLLAGIAILSGILDVIASRLLTLMLLLFGALVWFPRLLAQPHSHMVWSGNAINLVIAGAAWVVADSISAKR